MSSHPTIPNFFRKPDSDTKMEHPNFGMSRNVRKLNAFGGKTLSLKMYLKKQKKNDLK